MYEYIILLQTKIGTTVEIRRYNSEEVYLDELEQLFNILNEDNEYVKLHDVLIAKSEISHIQGVANQITLS